MLSNRIFKPMLKNKNKPHNIPNEVKADKISMALENGLCAKVVMIHRKELDEKNEKIRQKHITSKKNKQ